MNLKRRIKSERGTSSESWRRLVVKQLNKIPELRIFFEKELICIYQLIIIHDTERNRENMMQFISSGNIKSLLGMQGKFPHDYDKVDYPGLNLLLLKSELNQYLIVYSEDKSFHNRQVIKIIMDNAIDKNDFDTRALVYPV